jgi:hypothetical protein
MFNDERIQKAIEIGEKSTPRGLFSNWCADWNPRTPETNSPLRFQKGFPNRRHKLTFPDPVPFQRTN